MDREAQLHDDPELRAFATRVAERSGVVGIDPLTILMIVRIAAKLILACTPDALDRRLTRIEQSPDSAISRLTIGMVAVLLPRDVREGRKEMAWAVIQEAIELRRNEPETWARFLAR